MIRGLFARLTGEPRRGQALFGLAVAEARRPHWFVEGGVPDTVDGRFSVLATVLALLLVRLEDAGAEAQPAAVALTERFVEAMDTEIREMGVGDPTLGKQVRGLVGALASRLERWREAIGNEDKWTPAVLRSLYRDVAPADDALAHSEVALRRLWARIEDESVERLADGRLT